MIEAEGKAPIAPVVVQANGATGTQDGSAAFEQNCTPELAAYRRFLSAIVALRRDASSVEAIARQAADRARELADSLENDEPRIAELAVRRAEPRPLAFGHAYDTALSNDLEAVSTAAFGLARTVNDAATLLGIEA